MCREKLNEALLSPSSRRARQLFLQCGLIGVKANVKIIKRIASTENSARYRLGWAPRAISTPTATMLAIARALGIMALIIVDDEGGALILAVCESALCWPRRPYAPRAACAAASKAKAREYQAPPRYERPGIGGVELTKLISIFAGKQA